ncbi:MAG: hypothetical protein JXA93_06355 [Anaerolineae bacterium]|nr:hypothetical protein [Anaerolineae bacterium]
MSFIKSLPARPTRDQLIAWKIQNGECGLIPQGFMAPCPRKVGPINPNPDHPRMVGFPGGDGYSTCSKCDHFLGLWLDSYICTRPNARAIAARALAEAIRRWEENQEPHGEAMLSQPEEKTEPQPEQPAQAGERQLELF